jgi:hypothetical protein
MAGGTPEFRQGVRNGRMLAEGDRTNVVETGFFQSEMASGAAVGDLLLGKPNLLNAGFEVPLESDSIGASANEVQVLLLITMPLVKMVFRWSDSEQDQ